MFLLQNLGHRKLNPIEYTAEVFLMIYLSLRAAFFDQAQGWRSILSVVSAQIYLTGYRALLLISALALATGSVYRWSRVIMRAR